jgi:hypothetical protein
MNDRCTTIHLDVRDLARSAEDPKLASLLRAGWRPIAHLVVEDGAIPMLTIVLAPPVAPTVAPLAPPSALWALPLAVVALTVVQLVLLLANR